MPASDFDPQIPGLQIPISIPRSELPSRVGDPLTGEIPVQNRYDKDPVNAATLKSIFMVVGKAPFAAEAQRFIAQGYLGNVPKLALLINDIDRLDPLASVLAISHQLERNDGVWLKDAHDGFFNRNEIDLFITQIDPSVDKTKLPGSVRLKLAINRGLEASDIRDLQRSVLALMYESVRAGTQFMGGWATMMDHRLKFTEEQEKAFSELKDAENPIGSVRKTMGLALSILRHMPGGNNDVINYLSKKTGLVYNLKTKGYARPPLELTLLF